jgi:hypothetical protein
MGRSACAQVGRRSSPSGRPSPSHPSPPDTDLQLEARGARTPSSGSTGSTTRSLLLSSAGSVSTPRPMRQAPERGSRDRFSSAKLHPSRSRPSPGPTAGRSGSHGRNATALPSANPSRRQSTSDRGPRSTVAAPPVRCRGRFPVKRTDESRLRVLPHRVAVLRRTENCRPRDIRAVFHATKPLIRRTNGPNGY